MKDFSFPKNYFQLIAMGASTGGTEALLAVLEKLPGNLPPIVITQHMPPVFTNMYAERLNRICKMEVREAKDGDPLYPGLCLIAPGGLQMQVLKDTSGMRVECKEGEKVSGHCPSIDYLFSSVGNRRSRRRNHFDRHGKGRCKRSSVHARSGRLYTRTR